MVRSILVPLDGSMLAERALPYAMRLARAASAKLLLVQAQPRGGRDGQASGHASEGASETAGTELHNLARSLRDGGIPTATFLDDRRPAEAIVETARAHGADLIVMSTHGRSGLDRWLYGSVAEEVLYAATAPVLLVPSICDRSWARSVPGGTRRIIVPLDGSELAETALPVATTVARLLGDELLLLQVIDPLSHAYTGSSMDPIADEHDAMCSARQYLERHARQLRRLGLAIQTEVQLGTPLATITERARDADVDLVVMATHARPAAERVVLGSTALGVLRRTNVPLLLVRSRSAEPVRQPRAAPSHKPAPLVLVLTAEEAELVRQGLEQIQASAMPDDTRSSQIERILSQLGAADASRRPRRGRGRRQQSARDSAEDRARAIVSRSRILT